MISSRQAGKTSQDIVVSCSIRKSQVSSRHSSKAHNQLFVERRPPCFRQNAFPAAGAFSRPVRHSLPVSLGYLFSGNPQTPKSPTPSLAPEGLLPRNRRALFDD